VGRYLSSRPLYRNRIVHYCFRFYYGFGYLAINSISISTILESESNVNGLFNYLVDNFSPVSSSIRKSRRARRSRELMTHYNWTSIYILMEFGSFNQLPSYISPPRLCISPRSSVVLISLFNPLYLLFLPAVLAAPAAAPVLPGCWSFVNLPGNYFPQKSAIYFEAILRERPARPRGLNNSPETFSQKT